MSTELSNHIIGSQKYDIAFDNESGAYELQNNISKLQELEINNLLDKVLTRYGYKDKIVHFDNVSLELGVLPKVNYEEEMLIRIEEELTNFLKSHLLDNGFVRNGKVIELGDQRIEIIRQFLLRGYLEWNVANNSTPAEIIHELLSENDPLFNSELEDLGKKEYVRTRLVYQFSEATLESIVNLIAGEDSEYIVKYKKNILIKQEQQRVVPTTKSNFRNALWEIILEYLFVESSTYSNKKNFLAFVIRKVTIRYDFNFNELLLALRQSPINRDYADHEFSLIIDELIKESGQLTVATLADHNYESLSIPQKLEKLSAFLYAPSEYEEHSIHSTRQFESLLVSVLKSTDERVEKSIQGWVDNEFAKNTLIKRLTQSELNQLVAKIRNPFLLHANEFFNTISESIRKVGTESSRIWQSILERKSILIFDVLSSKQLSEKETYTLLFNHIQQEYYDQRKELSSIIYRVIPDLPEAIASVLRKHLISTKRESKLGDEFTSFIEDHIVGGLQKSNPDLWINWLKKNVPNWANERNVDQSEIWQSLVSCIEKQDFIPGILESLQTQYHISRNNGSSDLNTQRDEKLNEAEKHRTLIKEVEKLFLLWAKQDLLIGKVSKLFFLYGYRTKKDVKSAMYSIIDKFYKKQHSTEWLPQWEHLSKQIQKSESTQFENRTRLHIAPIVSEIEKIISKHSTYSEWSNQLEIVFKKYTAHYQTSFIDLVDEIIHYLNSASGYARLVGKLRRWKKLNEFTLFNDMYDNADDQLLSNVKYVISYGKLPWWIPGYGISSFNKDLANVIEHQSKKFTEYLLKEGQISGFVQLVNRDNYDSTIQLLLEPKSKSDLEWINIILQIWQEHFLLLGIFNSSDFSLFRIELLEMLVSFKGSISKAALKIFENWINKNVSIRQNPPNGLIELLTSIHNKYNNIPESSILQHYLTKDGEPTKPETIQSLAEYLKLNHFKDDPEEKSAFDFLALTLRTSPYQFKQWIEKANIRDAVLNELNDDELIALLSYELNTEQLRFFKDSLSILHESEILLGTKNFAALKHNFFEAILINLSYRGFNSWTIENWSRLVFHLVTKAIGNVAGTAVFLTELGIDGVANKSNDVNTVLELVRKDILDSENKSTHKKEEDRDYKKLGEEVPHNYLNASFTSNAGLVLIAPYLGMLFERCSLISEGKFIDEAARSKGVQLLEYAATGLEHQQEHKQLINKVLCGMKVSDLVDANIELTKEDQETVDSLLYAITQQWDPLNGTSIDGLRETFIQRDGKLDEEEEQYFLKVEQKSFDMLLDQLPWSIAHIKLSWMPKLIQVEWR